MKNIVKELNKKMTRLLVLIFFVFFYSNLVQAQDLKIIDGDTIVLNGEKIRFSVIDTPELKQTCMDR